MKTNKSFSEQTPPRLGRYFAKFFALFFCLAMGMNVWGETASLTALSPSVTGNVINFSEVTWETTTKNVIVYDNSTSATYMAFSGGNAIAIESNGLKGGSSSRPLALCFNVASKCDIDVVLYGNGKEMTATLQYMGTSMDVMTASDDGAKATGTQKASVTTTTTKQNFPMSKVEDAAAGYYKIICPLTCYIKSITLTSASSSDPVCSATAPGDITKGEKGNPLTLTAAGSPAANNTWYWQTAEDGTSTANAGATFDVTAAGTYYVRSYCSDVDGCWSAAKSIVVTESDLVAVSCPEKGERFKVVFNAVKDYSLNTTKTAEEEITSSYATVTNGKAYAGTNKNSDQNVSIKNQSSSMQFLWGSSNTYLKLELDCPLANGDVISFESTTNYELSFTLNTTRTTTYATSSKTYTVTEGDGLKGQEVIYLWRYSGSSTYVHSITIRRPVFHSINYAEVRGADMSAYPTQYEEGVGVASFADLANVTGWDFAGWSPASISTEATTDQTITATWTPQVTKYTVTYAKGDEAVTGDVPTQESLAEGANFTVAGKGDLAWTDHKFVGWKDQDETAVAAGANYTMPAKDVTLTAQWNEVTTYDVTFNLQSHGAALEAQHVLEGETATKPADPKAELYTFGGWYTEAECTNAFDFATTITAAKELFAKWTAFGEATSINIEQFVIENTKSGDIQAALTTANFDYQLESDDVLDDVTAGKDYENVAFRGLKLKHNGSYVVGKIPANTRVNIVLGQLISAKVQIDGVDAAALVGGSGDLDKSVKENYHNGNNYYDLPAGGVLKVMCTQDSKTTVLKGIILSEIPAVSDNAKLATLNVAGSLIEGFNAETETYNVSLPYGTVDVPEVTATAADANAKSVVVTQAVSLPGAATVVVTAEDNTTTKTYTINFTVAPKQGVSIIKATHTGATTANIEGLIGGSVDKNTQAGGKLGSPDHYFGIKLAEGMFQAGDVLTIYASAPSTKVQIFSDKGTNMLNEGVFVDNVYTFTLEDATEWIYLYRTSASGSDMNPTLGYMEVRRSMAPVITSFVIGEAEGVIDQENKTIAVEVANDADLAALTAPVIAAVGNGGAPAVTPAAQTDFSAPVVFTATDAYGELSTNYTVTVTKAAAPAATPTITTQPVGQDYLDTEVIAALTVVASTTDGGVLSYQWYKGSEAIDGATAAEYTPTEAGSYKVVVTNTLGTETAEVESEVAVITISHIYTFNDWDGASVNFTKAGEWTMYSSYNSGKELAENQTTPATTFKADQRVDDANVDKAKVNYTNYVTVVFAKDMQAVQMKAYNSSSRTLNNIYTLDVVGKKLTEVSYDEFTKTSAQNSTTKVSTMDATGLFEAGVYYVFKLSGSCNVFDFFATAAPEKSADPAVATLVAETVCSEGIFATLNAVTSTEATYAYQWYKDDAEFATTQTINPTEGGEYYCVVTNTETDKRANVKETNKVTLVRLTEGTTVSVNDGLAKTSETVNLVAEAAGAGTLTYAWYTCDDAEGTNPVVIGGAEAASYTATVGTETAYYMVEVTGDCGTASAVATVNVKPETYELLDVAGNMTWDFTNKAAADGDAAAAAEDKGNYVVLANTNIKSTFANKEYMAANYNKYTAKAIQAAGLKIHTTVPGFIIVTFAQTGGDKVRELFINNVATGAIPNGTTNLSYTQFVEAGDVVLTSWEASTSKWQMFNYAKIEFVTELADSKFESVRTLTSSNIGTICLENGVAAFRGATFYEIAYKEVVSGEPYKIFFDQVDHLEAGKPYIFEPEEGASEIMVAYDGLTAAEAGSHNGLVGTFEAIAAEETNVLTGNYLVSQNRIRKCGANCSLAANRAYIVMEDVSGEETVAPVAARRISLGTQATDMATDLESLSGEENATKIMVDGVLFILRHGQMYDSTGRLVK